MPRDLIEKYAGKGLSASEMATALLARAALKGPEAPPSAVEVSEKRLAELIERMGAKSAKKNECRSPEGRVRKALDRILRKK
jgi:hypothetical protein